MNSLVGKGVRLTGQIQWSSLYTLGIVQKENILELGTYIGFTTCILASSIKGSGKKVYTVDLFEREKGWSAPSCIDNEKFADNSQIQIAKNLFKDESLEEDIILHKGTSTSFFLEKKYSQIKFGLVYIDASHLYKDVYKDIENSYERLEVGGYMVLDDFLTEKPDKCQVNNAIFDYLEKYTERLKILSIIDRQIILLKSN